MEIEIKGLEKSLSNLSKAQEDFDKAIGDVANEILDIVDREVVRGLQSVKYGTGEINRSNQRAVIRTPEGYEARYWNDNPIAMYREFGTGQVGQANHSGITPDISPIYKQQPWFIPESETDVDLEEVYGMPKIKIKDKFYYRTKGQPARPFMYPASVVASKELESILEKKLNEIFN